MKASDQIVLEVASKHGFMDHELRRSGKSGSLLAAVRAEAIYRLRTELHLSYPRIATCMGLKDHTSAIAAINRYLDGKRPNTCHIPEVRPVQKKLNGMQYAIEYKNAQRINSYWAKKGINAKARVEKTPEGYRVVTDPVITKFNGRE